MGRPAKKRSYWEAKKRRAGELQAEAEYQRKRGFIGVAKDKLLNAIDHINPLEFAAVCGMSVLVYSKIKELPELTEKAMALAESMIFHPLGQTEQPINIEETIYKTLFPSQTPGKTGFSPQGSVNGNLLPEKSSMEPSLKTSHKPGDYGTVKQVQEGFSGPDFALWITSFALAYIIVHNAGQILGLLNTGLTGILKLFLLGTAAPGVG